MLAKNPGFTAVAVLCMALGIGANTTVYSIVEAALFRPFPVADPGRIVALHRSSMQEPSNDSFSYLDLLDLQRQSVTLSSIAGYASQNLTFALGVNRLLGRLLYEISPTDPASYALIALFLAGVAVLASALPARRALDADPLEALRHE